MQWGPNVGSVGLERNRARVRCVGLLCQTPEHGKPYSVGDKGHVAITPFLRPFRDKSDVRAAVFSRMTAQVLR